MRFHFSSSPVHHGGKRTILLQYDLPRTQSDRWYPLLQPLQDVCGAYARVSTTGHTSLGAMREEHRTGILERLDPVRQACTGKCPSVPLEIRCEAIWTHPDSRGTRRRGSPCRPGAQRSLPPNCTCARPHVRSKTLRDSTDCDPLNRIIERSVTPEHGQLVCAFRLHLFTGARRSKSAVRFGGRA